MRDGKQRTVAARVVAALHRRGETLADVAAGAKATYRYVQDVINGRRMAFRPKGRAVRREILKRTGIDLNGVRRRPNRRTA